MPRRAPNINYLWTHVIVEELVRCGADMFCISPGSRSAPLALAVAEHDRAKRIVHFDERGTAFYALGHGKSTGRPAVFICTSGTAVANALPAVVEASMSRVPLIVVSADRPPELQDAGANQTIVQSGIFGGYTRWSHTLACPNAAIPLESVLTTVDQAVYRAKGLPAGPVHLNCMFREPLTPSPEKFPEHIVDEIEAWSESGRPFTSYTAPVLNADAQGFGQVEGVLGKTSRGLFVIGQLDRADDREAALSLARHLGWPVLADVASGLCTEVEGVRGVHWHDRMFLGKEAALFEEAEVVLHVGGAVTSKRLNGFLASRASRIYVRVAEHPFREDPWHSVTLRVTSSLCSLAEQIEGATKPAAVDSGWIDRLLTASARSGDRLESLLASDNDLSEIAVARLITKHAPSDSAIFFGNSMPIRDADMFGHPTKAIVIANRGASGIDGGIATAAGYAAGLKRRVTAVLGDLSVLHDLNSLALLRDAEHPVVLIVINNDGGGIFSLLPIADSAEHFESVFGTPHGFSFQGAAKTFGLRYQRAESIDEFESAYRSSLDSEESCIIEVHSDRKANAEFHKELDDEQRSE